MIKLPAQSCNRLKSFCCLLLQAHLIGFERGNEDILVSQDALCFLICLCDFRILVGEACHLCLKLGDTLILFRCTKDLPKIHDSLLSCTYLSISHVLLLCQFPTCQGPLYTALILSSTSSTG